MPGMIQELADQRCRKCIICYMGIVEVATVLLFLLVVSLLSSAVWLLVWGISQSARTAFVVLSLALIVAVLLATFV